MLGPTDRAMVRRIWRLAWPTILYGVLETTVGLVDLVMVRSFGPEATAAVGVSRQLAFFVDGFAVAISTGAIALVSQEVGAGRTGEVGRIVRLSIRLVLLLGLPMTLIGWLLSGPLLRLLCASPETLALGEPYLQINFAGTVAVWGCIVGAAVLRGQGNAMTPLVIAIGVNLINVLLNYVLIFGAGPVSAFGVSGAAAGTTIARGLGALAYLGILLPGTARSSWARSSWDWQLTGRLLRIGMPMAMTGALRNGSRLVFLAILGASVLGMSFHAAVGVGMQVRLLSILPAIAFQMAIATLVGQAIGREDFKEATRLAWQALFMLSVLTSVIALTILLFSEPLAAFFIDSPALATLGAKVLRWFALAQFFSAISIGIQGALMAAGDTKPALRYTLLTQWMIMLPMALLAVMLFESVPEGPLLAWTLAPAVSLVLMIRRFRGGKWKTIRV